jgi:hypothetical protein
MKNTHLSSLLVTFLCTAMVLLFAVTQPVLALVFAFLIPFNLASVSCPRCNALLPQVRKPRSSQQTMWGGWTCPKCGVDVDKWGREVTAARSPY